jgi:thioesterase domain-containing protein/acyl carrier protein
MTPTASSPATAAPATAMRERGQFALAAPAVAPATAGEGRLLQIWEQVLEIQGLGVEDDYFELGGDSLVGLILFGEVESAFGVALPVSTLLDCPTVRLLAQRLEEDQAPAAETPAAAPPVAAIQAPTPVVQRREAVQRPLIAIRPEGSLPPLFFTHTILGDVVFVRQFLPYLPPEQPLYAIQARGLEGDDPPHTDFEEMASDFVKLIRKVQPAGPYFLAGLCDGSLTAVEMARILRAAGEEVAFVGLIDPRANPVEVPWLYWKNPEAPATRLQRWVVRRGLHLRRRLGPLIGLQHPKETVERPVQGAEMQRRHLAIRIGMTKALTSYRPRPYGGAITVFASTDRIGRLQDVRPGWGALARQWTLHPIAAAHVDIFAAGLPKLGARFGQSINEALR